MLNWSSSAADGHHSHLEYKTGARARPKLSHPAPVKRGAGGLPSFPLTFLHSVFLSQFLNFLICYRSWAFCSWTLLKLLTMLRKVTNLIKRQLKLIFVLRRTNSAMSLKNPPREGRLKDRLKPLQIFIHFGRQKGPVSIIRTQLMRMKVNSCKNFLRCVGSSDNGQKQKISISEQSCGCSE